MKIPIENFEIAYFSMHDGKRKLIENCVLTSRWCIIEYSKNWCYFCRRLRRTRYLAGKLAVNARELLIPFYITASIHQRFSLMCIYARAYLETSMPSVTSFEMVQHICIFQRHSWASEI